ncbi:MAG: hypothetical protein DRP93_08540 [Candidatus Neomarinimicrobiota bacterium]|nr:MAG: hypothetical protein DRP93_08540 [Candidatus Neomarinimicrobiota bacterium]
MDILPDELPAMVFKRVIRGDLSLFALDGQMLSALMEFDGKKTLANVAQKVGLNTTTMKEIASKLLTLKLIDPVETAFSILDNDFFDYLNYQLSLIMGPISEILIEDAVEDLGHNLSQFPNYRAAELVDLLARQIRIKEKRTEFKHNMINKINER